MSGFVLPSTQRMSGFVLSLFTNNDVRLCPTLFPIGKSAFLFRLCLTLFLVRTCFVCLFNQRCQTSSFPPSTWTVRLLPLLFTREVKHWPLFAWKQTLKKKFGGMLPLFFKFIFHSFFIFFLLFFIYLLCLSLFTWGRENR